MVIMTTVEPENLEDPSRVLQDTSSLWPMRTVAALLGVKRTIVKIEGTNRHDLNGKFAHVQAYDPVKGRYSAILLDNTEDEIIYLPPTSIKQINILDATWFAISYAWQAQSLDKLYIILIVLLAISWRKQDIIIHRMSEIVTVTVLLLGVSFIGRFLLSEYNLVKEKAESMVGTRNPISTVEMIEYRVEHYFSTSQWAKVALLLTFTFILISMGAVALAFCGDDSISGAVWLAWTFVADPGTHADAPEGFLVRFVSFSITVGGMLIFALMIGIISDYIGNKIDELKKGKSRVIESDHSVMLGWTDKSIAIIQQISLANESEGGGTIVVLADAPKEDLEEHLASAMSQERGSALELMGTNVVFRSGNPLEESELQRVSVLTARSVIVLSPESLSPDEADANQVRQVMALKALDGVNGNECPPVVVEVQDVDNSELFTLVAPDFAEVIVAHDLIGRFMLECARYPGLACVLESMMGFEGSEFYFEEWPELKGKSFLDITCRFDDAVPIGIKSNSGKVFINPKNDHIIQEGDKILVLAEDNDTYEVNDGSYETNKKIESPPAAEDAKQVEKIMFLGWRRDMADLITQLDGYVAKGSELWLFNTVPVEERNELLKDQGHKSELKLDNLLVYNVVGNPLIRRDLSRIVSVDHDGETVSLDEVDSILILADSVSIENGATVMSCDSRSLSTLLIIQDIQKRLYDEKKEALGSSTSIKPVSPITEILDSRTRSLLDVVSCGSAYVMSNQIISSVIAQVSEDRDINAVLRELLTAEGSETYIRSVSKFVDLKKEDKMSFWDIALKARQHREVAIGYKPAGLGFREASLLIINPPDKSLDRQWAPGDEIITFALD
uniref:Ion channel DMI1 n=1 Tax=Skeletonema marinoi TaxID=267567 RepID=A0A7S2PHQ8_9STRA|mmetsp:Transcript_22006/g.37541  ORF Transcript_22006/g.37541 Transcript_22006/m.37541 type:complete len:846 (+) Transcript_22006:85-2622(+)